MRTKKKRKLAKTINNKNLLLKIPEVVIICVMQDINRDINLKKKINFEF